MNITGEIVIAAPREAVFDRIRDPNVFASFIPGVSGLSEIGPDHYSAVFETSVAYMRFKFDVVVEITRAERPNLIEARISGRPLAIVGQLSATSTTTLVEAGPTTTIRYAVEAALSGKLGSIGQPVLRAKARDMELQFSKNLQSQFA